jgi:DNA phosphorothioation-associated putative methyltransferase
MNTTLTARHRTALQRRGLSRPIRLALEAGLITRETDVLDYGCGYGDDLRGLRSRGILCAGWDPIHRPRGQRKPVDVVNLGYVVNVIENAEERRTTLHEAWALTRKLLIVSARLIIEATAGRQTPYEDGCLTQRGTFQKYYQQHELRGWIDETLRVSSVPAGPGIFYVFRDPELRQSFLAARYRQQAIAPRQYQHDALFEQYKALLAPLMAFVTTRGRLPEESELDVAPQIYEMIGSFRHAFAIIQRVTGADQWNRIREARAQDLLIYLALAHFDGRPRFSDLPRVLQLDVRALFSTYRRACALADDLLFSAGNPQAIDAACRATMVGKLTPSALYVHISVVSQLPPILRIYEGCARTYIGIAEGVNLIKLHRGMPQVSYLAYPDFERDPHPVLVAALIVPLKTFRIQYRDYTDAKNPPILHRKETFLPPGHPLYAKFERLTRQEERWGLYARPEVIGTREGWRTQLDALGVRLCGHRIIRNQPQPESVSNGSKRSPWR